MSILNKTLTVNFGDVSDVPEIRIVQGEEAARVVHFKLSDAAGAINLTGCTARIYILPYGETTPLYEDLTITAASSGKCDYLISGNAAAIAGEGKYWIEILQTGSPDPLSVSYSGEGAIIVAPRQDFTGAIEAGTEFSALLSALAIVDTYLSRIVALETARVLKQTTTNYISPASAGLLRVTRVGNAIQMLAWCNNAMSSSDYQKLWDTIPVGYRPANAVDQDVGLCHAGSGVYSGFAPCYFKVSTGGEVTVISPAAGKTGCVLNSAWITNDAYPA